MLKRLLGWWIIIALLVLTVRMVMAEAVRTTQTNRKARTAMGFFHKDTLKATHVGWVDIIGDTVVVFIGIQNGKMVGGFVKGPMSQVDSIILLQPVQTATLKPRMGGP